MTAVEAGYGHFPAVRAKHKMSRLSTAGELAAIFDECIILAQLQQSTRSIYWGSWKTVLSWGVAHDEVGSLVVVIQNRQPGSLGPEVTVEPITGMHIQGFQTGVQGGLGHCPGF